VSDRVTLDDKGEPDEIFGSRFGHLERLRRDEWFLLVGHEDGTETAVRISGKIVGWEKRGNRND
jgi:hypothetical protein